MKRNIIILVLLVVAAGAVIYNQAGDNIQAVFTQEKPLPTETGAKAGLLAPTFTLKGMDDKTYAGGGARDKAMVVNFGHPGVSRASKKPRSSISWRRNMQMSWKSTA